MAFKATLAARDYVGPYRKLMTLAERRIEAAALLASHNGAQIALREIRGAMAGAGLGRLGRAIGATSDLQRGRGVHRRAGGGFSASGIVFVRSKSERTRGAIRSYTEGAQITPKRSRWLWITGPDLPRVTGRFRMTPELYEKNGWASKLGPLVKINGPKGTPLLIVRNVGVSLTGKGRSAKSLKKNREPRKGQVKKDFIVAFIGIPGTARAARVNVPMIMRQVQAQMPELIRRAIRETAK